MSAPSEPRLTGITLSRLTAHQLWQVLQLFRPYLPRLVMLAAATGLVTALNGASQVALTPLLEIVLNTQRAVSASASFTGDLNDMGLSLLTFMRSISGSSDPWVLLVITSVTYLVLIVTQQGGSLLTQLLATRLRVRINNGLVNKLFTHILYLPLSFIKAHPVGWVQSRMTMDVDARPS
ncbi:MAG: hypothetical protein IT326_08970 [Anaerolineae bacterium]|nr:hypothetical protein [Anaerolineae bacterium]